MSLSTTVRCGLAAAIVLAAVATTSAEAQTPPPAPAIIVVDMNQIVHESKAAKDVQAQLEKQQAAYSKEVSQQENDLKNMQDELERQRTILAPDAFAARSQDFQRRYMGLDHDVQMKRQGLQQSLNDAMGKVENAALQIITQIAKERKANMVLSKAALVYETDTLDITPEVIRRLDQKLPSLAVKLPPSPPASAAAGALAPMGKKH